MIISRNNLIIGSTAVLVAAVTITGAGIHWSRSQAFFQESPKELVDEVWQVIEHTYVDATFNQVDWKAIRSEYLDRPYTSQEEAYTAIKEMLGKLEDPYTRFMDPKQFEALTNQTSGEVTGIGIRMEINEQTKR